MTDHCPNPSTNQLTFSDPAQGKLPTCFVITCHGDETRQSTAHTTHPAQAYISIEAFSCWWVAYIAGRVKHVDRIGILPWLIIQLCKNKEPQQICYCWINSSSISWHLFSSTLAYTFPGIMKFDYLLIWSQRDWFFNCTTSLNTSVQQRSLGLTPWQAYSFLVTAPCSCLYHWRLNILHSDSL